LNGCETGEVESTPGFDLPARFIIHAVGPRRDQSGMLLSFGYLPGLYLAVSKDLRSAVFPCLSTGILGFDKTAAADIGLGAVSFWLCHRVTSSTVSIVFAIR
jgi:O-acetyl-ADP-ribose deacetylase (regulator of RNase III)